MKKTFVSVMAAVLALIMVLSFAACGTKPGETGTTGSKGIRHCR